MLLSVARRETLCVKSVSRSFRVVGCAILGVKVLAVVLGGKP